MKWSEIGDDALMKKSIVAKTMELYGTRYAATVAWLDEFDPDIKCAMHPSLSEWERNLRDIIWDKMSDKEIQAACSEGSL